MRGREVKGVGIGLFKWLHKTALERGVRMMFSTRVESLVVDSAGTVSGVRASQDGASFEVAARAVILATGGFQGNRDMLAKYTGRELSEDVITVGSPENTGDGHRMAIEAGAAMRHLDVCHVRTTDNFFGPGPSRYLMHIYPLGIYFNRNFERFVDEGVEDSDTIANAIALQPGAIAGLIFDDKARRKFSEEYSAYPRREQLICTADTIAELAVKMQVSTDGLCRLVDAFNASVKDGSASGPNLPKTRSALLIDTPPFHGFYPVRPALNHTLGGIIVDGASSQVVDVNGRPIAGLFAAGTVVNWANGRALELNGIRSYKGSYHAGASSGAGLALVLGRLAAQHALAELVGAEDAAYSCPSSAVLSRAPVRRLPSRVLAQVTPVLPTVRVATQAFDDMTAMLYAQRMGWFQRAGLDVQIERQTTSGAAIGAAILGGTFDIGKMGLSDVIQAHEKGIPFVIVAPAGSTTARHRPPASSS